MSSNPFEVHVPLIPEEQELFDAVVADPTDDSVRSIYADWLEERGDLRAEYLRLEVEIHQNLRPELAKERVRRLEVLAGQIAEEWRTEMMRNRVEGCQHEDGKSCGLHWFDFEKVEDYVTRRNCPRCKRRVWSCVSDGELTGFKKAYSQALIVVECCVPRT